MRTDLEVQRDLQDELRWSPQIDDTDVAVKVVSGVATLTGFVRSLFDKYHAENVAKRVQGVAGIANDLMVRPSPTDKLDDPEIARAAVAAIRADQPEIANRIRVLVHQGHVTLEGSVEWRHQHDRAEATVRHLTGVMGVRNELIVSPSVQPVDIKKRIEAAFKRSAEVDANQIRVHTDGSRVVLSGRVRTWTERTQAQATAWSAPGVTHVQNEITIAT